MMILNRQLSVDGKQEPDYHVIASFLTQALDLIAAKEKGLFLIAPERMSLLLG